MLVSIINETCQLACAARDVQIIEREITVERVSAGLAAARDRGTPLGRKTRVKPVQQQWIHKLAGEQYSQETIAAMTGLSRAAVGRVLRGEIASLPELAGPDQDDTELPITGQEDDRDG